MRWYPKTLKCQVYEDDTLLDLNSCGDPELEALADAIFPLIRSPVNAAIWLDVEIYEKQYWFKPPKNSIEIVALKPDPYSMSGKKQVSISQLYVDKLIGRFYAITPENTTFRKWSSNLKVAFVV